MADISEFEPSAVAKFATATRQGAIESKIETHLTEYYNYDMIILVSYRVKSKRREEFRHWVSKALELYSAYTAKRRTSLRYRMSRKIRFIICH